MLHRPVLINETLDLLINRRNGVYFDGTCSTGTFSIEILKRLDENGSLIAVDLDPYALEVASSRLKEYHNITIIQSNYAQVEKLLPPLAVEELDGALLDLGVSSFALEDARRGFSHRFQAPLDLRFNPKGEHSAAFQAIEILSDDELASILRQYGELTNSTKLARAIKESSPQTTTELADIVAKFAPPAHRERTLAKAFQALRIYVNDELENIKTFLEKSPKILAPGARLAILTYHSLEDRIVKDFFRRESQDCICPPEFPVCACGHKAAFKILTPKPLKASAQEIESNPRARSARLRMAEKR